MDRRFVVVKPSFIAVVLMAASLGIAYAQDPDAAVVVTAPSPWSTLRSDSITASVQADVSKLPKGGGIDFKVVRRSGGRASTLFTKSVKMEDNSADVFLGRVRDVPLGGADFLSIEWSAPGTDIKGVVEPVGVVKLDGSASDSDTRGPAPARPPLKAVRLQDGVADAQASEALAGAEGFEVGGMKFSAGWNTEGLFVLFTPADGVSAVEFAFDLKCGKNAFLAWADRFIVYSAAGDSVSGLHSGARSADKDGIKFEDMAWGAGSLSLVKSDAARLVKARWYDFGAQPFEERNAGFAVFVKGRVKKQPASYPAAAVRGVPGTWGDITLAK